MNARPASPNGLDALRAAGLRVTAPRLAVLEAVTADSHADVDRIAAAARSSLGSLSKQAVYDILRVFVAAGLVRQIQPAGSPARYEARVGDNHHHLVCRRCGAIVDVDCEIDAAPCLEPSDTADYHIDEAEVTHWGLCPTCQG